MTFLAAALLLMGPKAGLNVGEAVAAFEPSWVTGPYADTNQCPVCEYGLKPMVIMWGQTDTMEKAEPFISAVNQSVGKLPADTTHAIFVDVNRTGTDDDSLRKLKILGDKWDAANVYLMSRPKRLRQVLKDYKLEPLGEWKLMIYAVKGRKVTARWIDPKPEEIPAIQSEILKNGR
ncbi:MAG: hypothetical protein JST35_02210 [Armatimonadetes bacterium]|nr:hypothetical protein [Armatimonadota bacterium]